MTSNDYKEEFEEKTVKELNSYYWLEKQNTWKKMGIVLLIYVLIIVISLILVALIERGTFNTLIESSKVLSIIISITFFILCGVAFITFFLIISLVLFSGNVNKKMEPDAEERFGYIALLPLISAGNTPKGIDIIGDMLRIAKGYNINPDEEGIAYAICKLQTFSDITDLNNELRNEGGLQNFINSSITNGWTSYGSDTEERKRIVDCLNKASENSQRGHVAKIVGDKISLTI